ncbi:MAG: hypothetical protein H0T42_08950 [Deltaproteobacteria bacterium]|nr:hypothetical protein [Deltaproteobacteria bacterium]
MQWVNGARRMRCAICAAWHASCSSTRP